MTPGILGRKNTGSRKGTGERVEVSLGGRKDHTGTRKEEEGATRGEDEAKGKPHPGGQAGGRWGGNQADLEVKAGRRSPAHACLGVTDFGPSEPAALRSGVVVL